MKKGGVVLVEFPFTDLKGSKLRPALVLISENNDVTVAFVTSNVKIIGRSDVFLNKSETSGLKYDSILKLNKIATLEKELIFGKLGALNKNEMNQVNNKLIEILDLKS